MRPEISLALASLLLSTSLVPPTSALSTAPLQTVNQQVTLLETWLSCARGIIEQYTGGVLNVVDQYSAYAQVQASELVHQVKCKLKYWPLSQTISGDSDFWLVPGVLTNKAKGVIGGSGTPNDPFIVAGREWAGGCLGISNTNAYVVVTANWFHDSNDACDAGTNPGSIVIYNARNVRITGNVFAKVAEDGVYAEQSGGLTIDGNVFQDTYQTLGSNLLPPGRASFDRAVDFYNVHGGAQVYGNILHNFPGSSGDTTREEGIFVQNSDNIHIWGNALNGVHSTMPVIRVIGFCGELDIHGQRFTGTTASARAPPALVDVETDCDNPPLLQFYNNDIERFAYDGLLVDGANLEMSGNRIDSGGTPTSNAVELQSDGAAGVYGLRATLDANSFGYNGHDVACTSPYGQLFVHGNNVADDGNVDIYNVYNPYPYIGCINNGSPATGKVLINGDNFPNFDTASSRGKYWSSGVMSGTISKVCAYARGGGSVAVAIAPDPGAQDRYALTIDTPNTGWNCASVSYGWSSASLFIHRTGGTAAIGWDQGTPYDSYADYGSGWTTESYRRGYKLEFA